MSSSMTRNASVDVDDYYLSRLRHLRQEGAALNTVTTSTSSATSTVTARAMPSPNRMPHASAAPTKRCGWCNTSTTSQWRVGPTSGSLKMGTLCNACGINYRRALSKVHSGIDLNLDRLSQQYAGHSRLSIQKALKRHSKRPVVKSHKVNRSSRRDPLTPLRNLENCLSPTLDISTISSSSSSSLSSLSPTHCNPKHSRKEQPYIYTSQPMQSNQPIPSIPPSSHNRNASQRHDTHRTDSRSFVKMPLNGECQNTNNPTTVLLSVTTPSTPDSNTGNLGTSNSNKAFSNTLTPSTFRLNPAHQIPSTNVHEEKHMAILPSFRSFISQLQHTRRLDA